MCLHSDLPTAQKAIVVHIFVRFLSVRLDICSVADVNVDV